MELLKKLLGAKKEAGGKGAGIEDIVENLRLLAKGESDIGELYQLCGDAVAEERAFWHELAKSERSHAEALLRMAALVEAEPGKYRPGGSFNVTLARLFRTHVHDIAAKMRKGEIKKDGLKAIAADIENSMVELGYRDLIKTNVPEYLSLARMLDEETAEHRRVFEDRMK